MTETKTYPHLDELYASADRNIARFREAKLGALEARWRMFKRGVDSAVAALNQDGLTGPIPSAVYNRDTITDEMIRVQTENTRAAQAVPVPDPALVPDPAPAPDPEPSAEAHPLMKLSQDIARALHLPPFGPDAQTIYRLLQPPLPGQEPHP